MTCKAALLLAAICTIALALPGDPPPKSPQESAACIKVATGYRCELIAWEPAIRDPVHFAFAPDGKLYVVEMGDYPLGEDDKGKPCGNVKLLIDADADGVYEKSTVFLKGLSFPTGVMPWRNGVLICCAPDLFYAEDTDGDGIADKREVLFTGFKEGNPQHRFNSLTWGLDNWIYGANGDSGGEITSLKTGLKVSISGRDFRCNPDTGQFEPVTGQTQYGRSRNDAGDWFGCNNINPIWHYPLEERYLRRNPHVVHPISSLRSDVPEIPGSTPVYPISKLMPRFNDPHGANHITSAECVMVYRDDLLFAPGSQTRQPADPTNPPAQQVFVLEPVHDLITRQTMTHLGSTFTSKRVASEQKSEFWASSDNWTRPVWAAAGPDGALYIADMYRIIIEHPQWIPKDLIPKLDLRAGHDKGRIYRVTPEGVARRPIPDLTKYSTAQLVAALDSPSGWQRDTIQQMLIWKQDPGAKEMLIKLFKESKNPLARLHALCTLDGMGGVAADLLRHGLMDSQPVVRRHALRLAERRLSEIEGWDTIVEKFSMGAPELEMHLASSLGYWNQPGAARTLAKLALEPGADRFLIVAVLSSVSGENIEAVTREIARSAAAGPPPAILLSGLIRTALGMNKPAALAPLISAIAMPKEGQLASWQLQSLGNLLDALEQAGMSSTKLASAGLKEQVFAMELAMAKARQIAADEGTPLELRAGAVALLARTPATRNEDMAVMARLLTPQSPRELQAAVVQTLSRRRDGGVPVFLLDRWKNLTPDLRNAALDALLSRYEWTTLLLDAIEKKTVALAELEASRRLRLLQSGSKPIRERSAILLGTPANPDRQRVIDSYAGAMAMPGDVERGRAVFKRACATCHQADGQGKEVGPPMSGVTDKSPQGLLIAILDPNRAVMPRYMNYIADTGEETYTGILAAETATSVTLLAADAQSQSVLRSELKVLKSSNSSLMPEGLEAQITAQEMADLFKYMGQAK